MDALEFLDAAIRLSASAREADKRSAISRAYYGVFHLSLQFIVEAGTSLSAAGTVHEKVAWLIQSGDCPASIKASWLLSTLRKERNRADYNLKATQFTDAVHIRTQIIAAQELVSALADCNAETARSEIHAKMRAYAQNTLRLAVADKTKGEM